MIFTLPLFFRFLLPKSVTAITLWPFIVYRKKPKHQDLILINHEKIHLRQQIELLVLPFYVFYLSEYLFWLLKHLNHYKAYRSISFEKEAYNNDKDLEYLRRRKFLSQWRRN